MSALINESMFRYLYNEMSAEESSDFISFLENDPASMEQKREKFYLERHLYQISFFVDDDMSTYHQFQNQ